MDELLVSHNNIISTHLSSFKSTLSNAYILGFGNVCNIANLAIHFH